MKRDAEGAPVSNKFKALLAIAAKVQQDGKLVTAADVDRLRAAGFGEPHILEAVLMVGLAKFANFVAFGLGTVPDFDNPKVDFPGGVKRSAAR